MTAQDNPPATELTDAHPLYCILVTGSRGWTDRPTVWRPLDKMLGSRRRLLIRNGKATKGADGLVGQWTDLRKGQGVTEDPHRADWNAHGYQAGFIRNGVMVKALPRPDLVMVWALPCEKNTRWCPRGVHPTHGTADCVEQARKAGLLVTFCPQGMSW